MNHAHSTTDGIPSFTSPADDQATESVFGFQSLASLLRSLGAGVLLSSLSVLLFRDWSTSSDLYRYYSLLAYSGALAGIGFLLSRVLQENKGARTFLSLALGAVAVNFTVLGALVLSSFSAPQFEMPNFTLWLAPSGLASSIALVSAIAVLTPIAYLGFSVFARASARRFCLSYIALNLVLVIPVRSSLAISLVALVMTYFVLQQLSRARRADPALATREGYFAMGALCLPLVLVLARNLYLYACDELMLTSLMLITYGVLRASAKALGKYGSRRPSKLIEIVQLMSAVGVALGVGSIITQTAVSPVFLLPSVAFVFAGLLVDLSLHTSRDASYRRAAAIIFAGGLLSNLLCYPSLSTAVIGLGAGLVVAVYGYSVQQKIVFLTGLVSALSGLVFQLRDVVVSFDFGSWGSLALVGIAAIVLASLLERYGTVIRQRMLCWRNGFAEWEY